MLYCHLNRLHTVVQNVYILRTVSKSLGGGIISAREYLDIVGSYVHHGVYMTCGRCKLGYQCPIQGPIPMQPLVWTTPTLLMISTSGAGTTVQVSSAVQYQGKQVTPTMAVAH